MVVLGAEKCRTDVCGRRDSSSVRAMREAGQQNRVGIDTLHGAERLLVYLWRVAIASRVEFDRHDVEVPGFVVGRVHQGETDGALGNDDTPISSPRSSRIPNVWLSGW
jgi:hypothetical protein